MLDRNGHLSEGNINYIMAIRVPESHDVPRVRTCFFKSTSRSEVLGGGSDLSTKQILSKVIKLCFMAFRWDGCRFVLGFEMFNVSDDQTTLAHLSGLEGEMTMPRASGDFQHLHSFLRHVSDSNFLNRK